MFLKSRFVELSDSLKSGFFADNVILTLARAKKRGKVLEEDRDLINDVSRFFQSVLEGFAWGEAPRPGMLSAESADAFSKATNVLPETTSSQAFKKSIEQLSEDARAISTTDSVDAGGADRLIDFFTEFGQAELQRTDDLINPRVHEHGSKSWIATKGLFGS